MKFIIFSIKHAILTRSLVKGMRLFTYLNSQERVARYVNHPNSEEMPYLSIRLSQVSHADVCNAELTTVIGM
jgi:hypothetical protein